jgi:hypothetical protein
MIAISAGGVSNETNAVSNETRSTRALLSQSDQNDWRTPRKYLEAAHVVMGAIDLDPASSAEANEMVSLGNERLGEDRD